MARHKYRNTDYIDDENPDWKNEECPVCFEKYWFKHGERYILVMPCDGIENWGGYNTNCKHYICCCCVDNYCELKPEEQRCPLCREDWSEWIGDMIEYNKNKDSSDDDDENE